MGLRKTTESFINDAIRVHTNKYDYSKVNYVNNRTKVCIICPEHGEFWQTPHDHLDGCICPLCAKNNRATKKEKVQKHLSNKLTKYIKTNMITQK